MLDYYEALKWIKANNNQISEKDAKVVAAVMSTPAEVKKRLHSVVSNAPYAALLLVITPMLIVDYAVGSIKEQTIKSYEEYVKEHGTQI